MTGFGRGEAGTGARRWVVECASVNRKQLEVVVSLPREVNAAEWEPAFKQRVQARVSRGRVQVQVRCGDGKGPGEEKVTVDEAVASAWVGKLRALGAHLGLLGDVTLAELLKLPGVIQSGTASVPDEDVEKELVHGALEQALNQMIAMREAEGEHLKQDLENRLIEIERLLAEIAGLAPQVTVQHRAALHQRLRDSGLAVPWDDERLIKEVALYADRCDISEELARAASHVKQFRAALANEEAVGRSLDFLAQEFFREFNTMGSKANHAGLAHLVVAAKTALEKIREQVQNAE